MSEIKAEDEYRNIKYPSIKAVVRHVEKIGRMTWIAYRTSGGSHTFCTSSESDFLLRYEKPATFFSVGKKYRWKKPASFTTYEIAELYMNDNPSTKDRELEALALVTRPNGTQERHILGKCDFKEMEEACSISSRA